MEEERIAVRERHHKSFLRVYEVLRFIAEAGDPVHQKKIAEEKGLLISNVQRALYTLERVGLVERAPGERGVYMLGKEIAFLKGAFVTGHSIVKKVYPELLRIRDEHGLSSALYTVSEGKVIPLLVVPLYRDLEVLPREGVAYDPGEWAGGFALGAWFSRFHLDEKFREFVENPENSAQFDEAIKVGCAVKKFFRGDLKEVSAPVRDHSNDVCGAVSLFVPADYDLEKGIALVKSVAEIISRRLGYGSVEVKAS